MANEGIVTLKTKVDKLYKAIDEIEPEQVDLSEIDRILEMVTDLEETCKQLKD
ncbi:SE1561 family protein [Lottiidibacillus patelloidae]|uniref:SE1561 family protein n=1 Tax=Lottiidibacillus patelloidae TaxID=2670334 RepID=UPI00130388A1|nr:SE1561 family protein [Lottiidibacillus patelloidae]